MTSVFLSVGDASGDAYAADLVREIRTLRPGTRFVALGGPEMEKAGVELAVDQRELAVGGLLELAPHLPRIARAWRRVGAALRDARPDLAVLVDSSGFNLPLASRLHRRGVPVLYYVSPQVWAWRSGRIRKLARRVDHLAVILPFETAVYSGRGLPVDFVGHPLVDRLRDCSPERGAARAALGLDPGESVVALLPGSRTNEVRHCLPLHLETARALHARDPRLRFVIPVAPGVSRERVEAGVRAARLPSLLRLDLFDGRSLEVLSACDAAIAKPGTGTLEATLLGRPLVVAGRGNAVSAAIVRRLVRVDSWAMPNLVAGERVVPELLQEEAEPERIADALLPLLGGAPRERQLARLAEVRERLGGGGAARRTAQIAEEMLAARGR